MFTKKYNGINYESTEDGAFILTDEDISKLVRELNEDEVNSWKQFTLDAGVATYIRYSDSLSFDKRYNLAIGEVKPNNKQELSFFQEFWNDTPKHQIKKKMDVLKKTINEVVSDSKNIVWSFKLKQVITWLFKLLQ